MAGAPQLPPRVLAALGPRMLELARDHADGAHPYLVLPEHTAHARQLLGPDKLLVVEQSVVVSDDIGAWRQRAHATSRSTPACPTIATPGRDRGSAKRTLCAAAATGLKRALVTCGVEAARARIQEHLDAGASTVVIQALGAHAFDVPAGDWATLAQALL